MKSSLCAALTLLLAALPSASASAAAIETLVPAPAPLAGPSSAAAAAVLPAVGGVPLSAPAALSAPDVSPIAGSSARAVPSAAAALACDSLNGPATIPLVRLASDPAAARVFLASHPDARGLSVETFQNALRRVYLTPPNGRGSAQALSILALDESALGEVKSRSAKALARVMNDVSRLAAEGMIRARISAPTPEQLDAREREWERDAQGRPIADVAVIGAGPAGLSTGLHAAHAGLKTVVFEAPFSPPELVADEGLVARLPEYRAAGQSADLALYALTRAPPILGARNGLDSGDPAIASARNELLQHFAAAADAIARRGGIVAERSRVESAVKDADGLWTLLVNGRVQRARKLVLAQGQVGVDVEHAQFPTDLRRAARRAGLNAVVFKDYRDLRASTGELATMTRALAERKIPARRLMINDALLGSAPIERMFRLLAPQTRVMVVGSGESAVKAAVAVLRLNPRATVDLYVKNRLQAAQLQIPAAHAAPEAIARALSDPAAAETSLREWEAIGTPVTPATLADLEALKSAGRLRIIPLGKKCIAAAIGDPDPAHTIEIARVRRDGREKVRVFAVDPEVIAHLRREGIGGVDEATGRWLISEIDGPIVAAVGYSRPSLRGDPITSALTASLRLVPTHGGTKATANEFALSRARPLRSAGDPDLYLVGAQNVAMSADSAIPGAVARAAAIVTDVMASLGVAAPRAPPSAVDPGPWRRFLAAVQGWTGGLHFRYGTRRMKRWL
jgi:hypothetical protein